MKFDALDIVGIIGLVFLLVILTAWAFRDKKPEPYACPIGYIYE